MGGRSAGRSELADLDSVAWEGLAEKRTLGERRGTCRSAAKRRVPDGRRSKCKHPEAVGGGGGRVAPWPVHKQWGGWCGSG